VRNYAVTPKSISAHFLSTSSRMKRLATAIWTGSLKEGSGNLSTPSWVLHSTQYSFGSRFESGPGINPDELIAAAHAGCYVMALSGELTDAGFTPERLEATAEVHLENTPPQGWTIAASHLAVTARVPRIEAEHFARLAEKARENCPVSRVLNAKITLDAKLL
jgi:osmotically inducible protein OsmC